MDDCLPDSALAELATRDQLGYAHKASELRLVVVYSALQGALPYKKNESKAIASLSL